MFSSVAQLQQQLKEKDEKLADVKEKAKAFVREKLAAADERLSALQHTSNTQLHKLQHAESQIADAEEQARSARSDLVCCETELADLRRQAGGAPAGTAAAASCADAESPAENTENFRLRVEALELELVAKDERLAEVKEQAKIFVRDKLKSVQELRAVVNSASRLSLDVAALSSDTVEVLPGKNVPSDGFVQFLAGCQKMAAAIVEESRGQVSVLDDVLRRLHLEEDVWET